MIHTPDLTITPLKMYHYLHRKNEHLVDKLDAELQQMLITGQIIKIEQDFLKKLETGH